MKIAFCAAEVTPFAKVGGLGDVVGSLPKVLAKLGLETIVILPRYGLIDVEEYGFTLLEVRFQVRFQGRTYEVGVWQGILPQSSVPVYLVDQSFFFGSRQTVYPVGQPDLEEKGFLFFSQAVLQLLQQINFQPDILHVHDWHTAPIAVDLKQMRLYASFFNRTSSVLTIHNLAYQGIFHHVGGEVNWLLEGIKYADFITTVSPTYAKEIQTPEGGAGLEEMIRWRAGDLAGILNGLDTDLFNPMTDHFLPAHYDAKDWMTGKAACKQDLLREWGFKRALDIPLIGMVSRLVEQKGIDIAVEAIVRFLEARPGGAQFMIVGGGEGWCEDAVRQLSYRFPQVKHYIGFHLSLAQRIYGASDIFLMPSRFEPCGLGQMIAMRYGTVPVVRATGGLADTVWDVRIRENSNGFRFYDASSQQLAEALFAACDWFKDQSRWARIVHQGMIQDFNWERSAKEYRTVYERVIYKNMVNDEEVGIANRFR